MAPSRGKGKGRATNTPAARSTATRRSTRKSQNGSGDVYDDLLAEADAESTEEQSDRPLKRRRVTSKRAPDDDHTLDSTIQRGTSASGKPQLQTVEDSSRSEDDSDESEFDFEDVDLEQASNLPGIADDLEDEDIADVSVAIDSAKAPRRTPTKRKPASAAERAYRLLVHKAHVLCLLGHCLHINSWCNNDVVHKQLRRLLSDRIVNFLNPRPNDSQFRQNEAFMDGLRQAADIFRGEYKVNASGMRSAQWETDPNDIATLPIDRADFISAAKNLEGSQDTGNQLFCALLRAVSVEARVVCSLQPLPFANASARSSTPQKVVKPTVFATAYGFSSPASGSNTEDVAVTSSSTIGKVPSARRRLGQPAFSSEPTASTASPKSKKPVKRLNYPIFWTEAFNPAHQKWIVVDPLVTQTVNKPSTLEPPASYASNQLSYAMAFEASAVVKDVTRRYARAFNAKTRRSRIESTENGTAWLKKVLRFFRRTGGALDRDQVEDAELAQREAREGLPANVLDFKDHPYYALERHMKRHEVIFPKREVGKVNAGTAAKPRVEAVFRRQDVCVCRSADKWYRLGRTVKEGETAVKRVAARRTRKPRSPGQEEEDGGDAAMTPLYAAFQTDLYIPPPVSRAGKVPRNAFGNLDIYVPSMVPAGGAHIRHPLARPAATALKVDVVDAVVGFQFKGRQGTAVIDGVIVAEVHADAVRAAIEGLEEDKVEEGSRARSAVALGMWRKFLVGLRIRERVKGYGEKSGEGDGDVDMDVDDGGEEGGGFLVDDTTGIDALPTAGRYFLAELTTSVKVKRKAKVTRNESEEEAEFEDEGSDDEMLDARPSTSRRTTRRRVIQDESENEYTLDHASVESAGGDSEEGGGGFILDDEAMGDGRERGGDEGGGFIADDGGGGFVPEELGDEDGGGGGFLPNDVDMEDGEHGGAGSIVVDAEMASQKDVDTTFTDQETAQNTKPESESESLDAGVHDDTETPAAPDDLPTAPSDEHSTTNIYTESDTAPTAVPSSHIDNTRATLKMDATPEPTHPALTEDAEDSDLGSMLSHDPEDEDAEPDWLESD